MILIKLIRTVLQLLAQQIFVFHKVQQEQVKFCLNKMHTKFQADHNQANTRTQPRMPQL